MSDIDISNLIQQMHTMAAVARSGEAVSVGSNVEGSFAQMLSRAIDHVDGAQKTAANMATAYELGDSNVSMAEVMIALQKANISFQAMLQVRNKLVAAYQEIMSMQI